SSSSRPGQNRTRRARRELFMMRSFLAFHRFHRGHLRDYTPRETCAASCGVTWVEVALQDPNNGRAPRQLSGRSEWVCSSLLTGPLGGGLSLRGGPPGSCP